MKTPILVLASFLSLCCCAAFAQDGADMLQKRQEARALERQQAREKLAGSEDKKHNEKSAVTSSVKHKDLSKAEEKPIH
ncbi:hypothetical protein V476_03865 [Pseudomonas syringae KCTC 12500]|uniref:hypothetical protein n=1 Tax=Pseudomonas syringae TaxID=317 RepID=UPI00040C1A69|nr:hypothetical protein [Pseudomonas syringae]KMY00323.1 hypothetical protein V476_03865 [Pseudomonas syringae KCTC 12500]KPY68351.1 Uncharacterized protein ALO45_03664 [Pseudomonas syringae pv. syringae]POR86252.1 hypothetical protein BKM21_04105 [Pseudomonas syringae pv. syringae]